MTKKYIPGYASEKIEGGKKNHLAKVWAKTHLAKKNKGKNHEKNRGEGGKSLRKKMGNKTPQKKVG